jgi:hypothetical protein
VCRCNYPAAPRRRTRFGYEDVRLLRDDGNGAAVPNRRNMLAHIEWLIGDARAGDNLFFHFSGACCLGPCCCAELLLQSDVRSASCSTATRHEWQITVHCVMMHLQVSWQSGMRSSTYVLDGAACCPQITPEISLLILAMHLAPTERQSQQEANAAPAAPVGHGDQKFDWSRKETDGKNETVIPSDYAWNNWFLRGAIVDDELNRRLVRPLPKGCILHCLTDTCHSGTNLDLPHVYTVCDKTHAISIRKEGGRCVLLPCFECSCGYVNSSKLSADLRNIPRRDISDPFEPVERT